MSGFYVLDVPEFAPVVAAAKAIKRCRVYPSRGGYIFVQFDGEVEITRAATGLVLLSQKVAADGDENHLFGRIHTSAMGRLEWVCQDRT